MIDWLKADPTNHVLGLLVLLLALWLLLDALVLGRGSRPRCNAPTKRGGRCHNPAPHPGDECAAGHGSGWAVIRIIEGVLLLAGAIYVLLTTPLPQLF